MAAPPVEAQAYQRRLNPGIVGLEPKVVNALLAALQAGDELTFGQLLWSNAKLRWLDNPEQSLTLPALRSYMDECQLKSGNYGTWQNGLASGPLIDLECDFNRRVAGVRTTVVMHIELDQGRIHSIRAEVNASAFG